MQYINLLSTFFLQPFSVSIQFFFPSTKPFQNEMNDYLNFEFSCIKQIQQKLEPSMNILTSHQMRQKELKLLELYTHSEIKFKLNFQQLLQVKAQGRSLFCFHRAQTKTNPWIQKLVPLHKKVHCLNLEQEQNGIFKTIAFVFLLIIYKAKPQPNFYVLEHLKCSLYSDDVDLLEVKNHSFNKKIKSDVIKSVIAMFFKQIEHLLETQMKKCRNLKIQDLLAFALQKNDMVMEGFHLFYRYILSKFQVNGANNCIEEVNPQQAIESLIDYFQMDCRIFNDLYLFAEAGIFLARIQENMFFGRYYENQLVFMETSDEQNDGQKRPSIQQRMRTSNNLLPKQNQIQTNDVKIFNFLLDTDRNTEDNYFLQKSQEGATPSFQLNEEMKFGKKTDRQLDTSFSKLKNRIQNEKINQISSEEEEIDPKKDKNSGVKGFAQKHNLHVQNKFLNLESEDQCVQSDAAPTPMLGGGDFFCFGKKQQESSNAKNYMNAQTLINSTKQDPRGSGLSKNQKLLNTKEIRTSAIRRQSYQGENSSQSKSSENMKKKQMKTSKNQIQVMDGTASQVNLGKPTEEISTLKVVDEVKNRFKQPTLGGCEQSSSYSNCTCHIEKRAKIKLNSQIVSVTVDVNIKPKLVQLFYYHSSRKISTQIIEPISKKELGIEKNNSDSRKMLFKNDSNKSTQNLKAEGKYTKSPANKQGQVKSPQFLNFLKKDKSELIKKLTEKRNAKQNVTSAQMVSQKNIDPSQKCTQPNKRYVKQSMFVGSYHLQNPQKSNIRKQEKNRSVTPNSSIDKHQRKRNERSRTPTQPNDKRESPEGMKLFKVNNSKQSTNVTYITNQIVFKPFSSNVQSQPSNITVAPCIPKSPITIKVPPNTSNAIPIGQQMVPISTNNQMKPYEFYLKR